MENAFCTVAFIASAGRIRWWLGERRQTAAKVVHAYEPRSVVEKPLPEGWEDPNFFHHGGHKVEPADGISQKT